jgi:hypothetical protein
MPRKQYEPYHYDDPDFAYTYPDSSVLRNNFNIQEAVPALINPNSFKCSKNTSTFVNSFRQNSIMRFMYMASQSDGSSLSLCSVGI